MGDSLILSAFSRVKTVICSYTDSLLVNRVCVLNERPAAGSVDYLVAAGGIVFKNWFCVVQNQNRNGLVTKLRCFIAGMY